uniref:phosphoribosyltransferase family protein n=1 Tax=uncultured Allobacillus sp. TaxID=1638025 RepID=UPI0025937652|nr:phosphoribosyltransferase family protein [uncultured Allobacillus sp.]
MFVSSNRLRGLVVDLDSFPEEFDEMWNQIYTSVSILFLSDNEQRLVTIQQENADFLTHNGTFSGFLTKRKSLVEVHHLLEMESYEVAVLSRNLDILKYIQGMNVSTIYFSEENYSKYEEVGNLPDFLVDSIADINQIINGDLIGYFSEAASMIHNGNNQEFNQGLVIVTAQEYEGKTSTIVSGGRYFSTSDIRYPIHQLSQRIIRNKDYPDSQVALFSSIFSDLTRFIEAQMEQVDVLTRIPPRPSQQKDRMIDCVNYVCSEKTHIQNAARSLTCSREYESQKFLNQEQRLSNIQGVFEVTGSFEDKHVVILDDVISTGSTALEAAKEFYETGAKRVTILVLAINQFRNSMITSHQPLECQCGGEYKMRFNRNYNTAFFGCSNYPKCDNSSLEFLEVVQKYNHLNKVDLDREEFEDTEWF